MKTASKTFLVFFLLPFFSFAQSNYKPGYVITLKGDTLHGFIDYREWDSNPTAVSFKMNLANQDNKQFTVNDISFFNVDGLETYKKYTCRVSKDVTQISNLSSSLDTSFKIETVFLKILQKGKNLTFYAFADDVKTRFYIGEAPDYSPAELVYHIYQDSNQGHTVYDNGYLKQLFALANKYNVFGGDLTHDFEKASYSEPDLLNIVSKINGISDAEYKKNYSDKTKAYFFTAVALNFSTTYSTSSSTYTQDGGGPHTSSLPAASLGITIVPRPNTDKLEFRAELMFSSAQFSKTYKLLVTPYVEEKASFNQRGISFIPQVIYNFYHSEKLKIYLGLGIDLTSLSYSKAFFGPSNSNVYDDGIGANNPYFFNTINDGIILKAGAKIWKKWEFFFNYIAPTPTTVPAYFDLNNSNTQIGVAYFWGK